MSRTDTRHKALKIGSFLLQSMGYNGFSFQHISDQLGIKKPSLFEHFKSKEELGVAIIKAHRERFYEWISSEKMLSMSPLSRLEELFVVYYYFCKREDKFCPISALSGEIKSLPLSMQRELSSFTVELQNWIEENLKGAISAGEIHDLNTKKMAEHITSLGIGVQLLAKLQGKPEFILETFESIKKLLK